MRELRDREPDEVSSSSCARRPSADRNSSGGVGSEVAAERALISDRGNALLLPTDDVRLVFALCCKDKTLPLTGGVNASKDFSFSWLFFSPQSK